MKSLKLLRKKLELRTKRNNNCNNIKNKTTRENYKHIKKVVAEKVVILEQKIKSHQIRKISHDKHTTYCISLKKRWFKKDVIVNKRKEKHERYKSKKKQTIREIKQNAPDQNTINLSNSVPSKKQKALLKKGPSFVHSNRH